MQQCEGRKVWGMHKEKQCREGRILRGGVETSYNANVCVFVGCCLATK